MAWNDPVTWAADQVVAADDLNEQIRDNMLVLKVAIDDTGKIPALSSTYFADLDASELTGVVTSAGANVFTAKNDFGGGAGGRLVLPVGSDKWAT